jgi:PAS domain S-box-containing protein
MTDKPTILVVDDEKPIIQAICDLLEDDYKIITAYSGEEGLGKLSEFPDIAVILCDQRMPKMNGSEFFRLAQNCSRAARILITGYSDFASVVEAINSGHVHAYIAKPFDENELRLLLESGLRSYRAEMADLEEMRIFRGLMDNVPDLMAFTDLDGRFIKLNAAMARHFGIAKIADAIGQPYSQFVSADEAVVLMEARRAIVKNGENVIHHFHATKDDRGVETQWSTLIVPVNDTQTGTPRAIGILQRNISKT